MTHKFKGKSVNLYSSEERDIILISIDKSINDRIHELYSKTLAEVTSIFNNEFGINPKDIIAFGKGNPSNSVISRIIVTKGLYWNKDTKTSQSYYPCFCNQETDPHIREKERMSPILHHDSESSFNCARESLHFPDYALILKVTKNGKVVTEDSN
jgi:hypothetical protein